MEFSFVITIVASALMAFFAVKWIYFKILKIAFDKNLVDNPDARKLQKTPVPVMGGVAVFFGILAGVLVCSVLCSYMQLPIHTRLLPVICGMSIMLYVGAMDDIIGLTPRSRLVVEVLMMLGLIYASGSCVDTLYGLWGIESMSWWVAVPFTVLGGVGIINAINMIDGVNGLSTGLCITCSAFFGIVFVVGGDITNAVLAFTAVAALLPFFVHNVFGLKSRMFIGDAGTMLMGVLLTWFLINFLSMESELDLFAHHTAINAIALAVAILSVPVADTLRVMGMRIAKGMSPFSPDKTHLHHAFIAVGLSHFFTTLSAILIDVLIVCVWFLSYFLGASLEWQLYIVILAAMFMVWGTYFFLNYHTQNQTKVMQYLTAFSVHTHWGRTEIWRRFTVWLDAPGDYREDLMSEERLREVMSVKYNNPTKKSHYIQTRSQIINLLSDQKEWHVDTLKEHLDTDEFLMYDALVALDIAGRIKIMQYDERELPTLVKISEE